MRETEMDRKERDRASNHTDRQTDSHTDRQADR